MDAKITFEGYDIKVLDGPYVSDGVATPNALSFAQSLVELLPQMRDFAAKELLELYNETWREEGSQEISPTDFAGNLITPKIVIYDEEGAAAVYFGDSDMFAGHSVEISLNEGEICYAGIIG